MNSQDLKDFYTQYIDEIFNQRKTDEISSYVSMDYRLHEAPPQFPNGPESIKAVVEMFQGAFPDFHVTLDELVVEGDLLASKSTFCGTHSASLWGEKATGKKVSMSSLTMVRIKEGKILESWVRNNLESLKAQIS